MAISKPSAYTGSEPYIFVSYAHKDSARVYPVIRALQERYNVWFDEGIRFGKEWDDEIAVKLMGCHVFLYVISEASLKSDNCKDEIAFARDNGKPFINLVLDKNVEFPDAFKLRFGRYQMCFLNNYRTSQDAVTALAGRCPEFADTVRSDLSADAAAAVAASTAEAAAEAAAESATTVASVAGSTADSSASSTSSTAKSSSSTSASMGYVDRSSLRGRTRHRARVPILIGVAVVLVAAIAVLAALLPRYLHRGEDTPAAFNLTIEGTDAENVSVNTDDMTIYAGVPEDMATFNLSQLQFGTEEAVVVEAYADAEHLHLLGPSLDLAMGINTFYLSVRIGDTTSSYVFTIEKKIDLAHHVHAYGEWNITIPATCMTQGEKTRTCACGEKQTVAIPTLGHDIVIHEAQAATCTAVGWDAYVTCSRCDYTTYAALAALGHDYEDEVTPPTCTTQGYTTHTCTRCEDSYVDAYVAAAGHTPATDAAVAPTCTEQGLTAGSHCAVCHVILEAQEVVPALDHEWQWMLDLASTKTTTGLKHEKCLRCETIRNEETVIPMLDCDHVDVAHHDAVPATCTEQGKAEYWYCNECTRYFSDEACQLQIEDIDAYVLPAQGHDYEDEVTPPTCAEQGYTTHTCTRCGDVYNDAYVDALGHNIVHHDALAPTCTAIGWTAYDTCTRCGYTTYVELAALGHDLVHHDAQEVSCTAIGWDAYDTCSRCDYTTYAEIAALGHDWHWQVDEVATKTTTGRKHEECSRCHLTRNENVVIPLVDCSHDTAGYVAATQPTCTATGKQEYWYCPECERYYSDSAGQLQIEDIDAFGVIPALGHNLVHHAAKAVSCTAIGWDAYDTCSRCDYTTYEEIAALGHDYHAVVTPVTCTTQGYTTHTCSRCADSYVDTYVVHTHNYVYNTCTYCGALSNGSVQLTAEGNGLSIAQFITPNTKFSDVTIRFNANKPGYTLTGVYVHYTNGDLTGQDIALVGSDRTWTLYAACGDGTLCGVWTANRYSIAYNFTGGSDVTDASYYSYYSGTTKAMPIHTTRNGYYLTGYRLSGSGTGGYNSNTNYFDIPASAYGNLTATAQWTYSSISVRDLTATHTGTTSSENGTEEDYVTVTLPEVYRLARAQGNSVYVQISGTAEAAVSISAKGTRTNKYTANTNAFAMVKNPGATDWTTSGSLYTYTELASAWTSGTATSDNQNSGGRTVTTNCSGDTIQIGVRVQYSYNAGSALTQSVHTATLSAITVRFGLNGTPSPARTNYSGNSGYTLAGDTSVSVTAWGNISAQTNSLFVKTGNRASGLSNTTINWVPNRYPVITYDVYRQADAYVTRLRKVSYTTYGTYFGLLTTNGTNGSGAEYAPQGGNDYTGYNVAYAFTIARYDVTHAADYDGNTAHPADSRTWTYSTDGMPVTGSVTAYGPLWAYYMRNAADDVHAHDYRRVEIEATCTTKGYSIDICSICHHYTYEQSATQLGHSYTSLSAQAATCTEEGCFSYQVCDRCGYSSYVARAALGHALIHYDAKAANCTEVGWNAYDRCLRCDHTTYVEIPSLGGHQYVDGVCTACGAEKASDGLHYVLDGAEYTVTGYTGADTEVYIPSTYNGKAVTTIASTAFNDCTAMTDIRIPTSVTTIEEGAFNGCSSLVSMTLPFVGYKASGTTKKEEQTLGYVFGTESYDGGSRTQQLLLIWNWYTAYIPATLRNVTVLGGPIKYAFSGCSKLTSITLPTGITKLDIYAFNGCTGLTEITIPSGVTEIGDSAFRGCTGLTEITIPTRVTKIGQYAFQGCTGLTEITIPSGVTAIGNYAFDGCTGLTEITIPTGVTTIGQYAFQGCTGLTEITIPTGVTTIGQSAFQGCTGLTSLSVAEGNTVYHSAGNCIIKTENNTLVVGCQNSVIPTDGSVTEIGNYAFDGCTGLTEITIPSGITTIGAYAFRGCTGLTEITIPTGVTSIEQYAFNGCTGLTEITIPTGVTEIGDFAFYGCTRLTTVYYGGTASEWSDITIGGDNAPLTSATRYYYSETKPEADEHLYWHYVEGEPTHWHHYVDGVCSVCGVLRTAGLQFTLNGDEYTVTGYTGEDTEVYIPSTYNGKAVTAIGDSAFYGCTGLTEITIPSGVTTIGEHAFYGCTGLTEITIPTGVTTIGYAAFRDCTGLTEIIIPSGVTTIGNEAFRGCTGLTEITIPTGVTTIGDLAFYGCTGLTEITIPTGVTTIGRNAFGGCTGLTSLSVTEGNTVYHSAGNCFIKTENNTLVVGCQNSVIPTDGSVTSIGQSAFQDCTGLTEITIPSGVTEIVEFAFRDCTGLTEIVIPSSVTEIGYSAFFGCTGLTTVYYGGTASEWSDITIDVVNAPLTWATRYYYSETEPEADEHLYWHYVEGEPTNWHHYVDGVCSVCGVLRTAGLQFTLNGDEYTVTGYTGEDTEVYIPSTYEGKTVTAIGEDAFTGKTSIVTMYIPGSVTAIAEGALAGCTSLERITLPFAGGSQTASNGYDQVFGYIFGYSIGDETTVSGVINADNVSYYTTETRLVNDVSTKYYRAYTYDIPASLTTVVFNGSGVVSNASSSACGIFRYCTNIQHVEFGGSITAIPSYAFYHAGVTSVVIGDSVLAIHNYAFYYSTLLSDVTIGDGVTTIGASAFVATHALDEIIIPVGVTTIGSQIFADDANTWNQHLAIYCMASEAGGDWNSQWNKDMSMLRYYTIATYYYSESEPEANANLYWRYVAGEPTHWHHYADGACTVCGELQTAGLQFTQNGEEYTVSGYTGTATEVIIPATYNSKAVTAIGEDAFAGKTSIVTLYVPGSVTAIAEGALAGCASLENLTIPFVGNRPVETTDTYQHPFAYIFGSDSFSGGTSVTQTYYTGSVSAPGSSTSIQRYVPATLRSVTVLGGFVPYHAFTNCSMLTSITLASGVTGIYDIQSNNGSIVSGCTNLQSFALLASVDRIPSGLFAGCNKLIDITLPYPCNTADVTSSSMYQRPLGHLFDGNSSSSATVAVSQTYYNTSTSSTTTTTFNVPKTLRSVTILGGYVPYHYFQGCTMLTSVCFSGAASIGESAVTGCTGLSSVTIGTSVTTIGANAFKGCTGLTDITFKGTQAQWTAISKGSNWDNNTGEYTVHCTDGDITK